MKITNPFKKVKKETSKTNVSKMDKTQLSKVIGGVDVVEGNPIGGIIVKGGKPH